MTNQLNSSIR